MAEQPAANLHQRRHTGQGAVAMDLQLIGAMFEDLFDHGAPGG
jgi:hypothetical protein